MDRKLELKRLLIYLAFAFGLAWALFFIFLLNGFKWDAKSSAASVISLGMLTPFIANIITRWITKEGFAMTGRDSLMLGISFQKKKWMYYILALVLPWLYFEVCGLLEVLVIPQAFDKDYYLQAGIEKGLVFIYPLAVIISTSIISFAALGEEGGWRGYMMPKLMKLLGYKKAIVIGGIIWGVWHGPLTCVGHNFGTDYPGFPYLGILVMCLFCTLIGIVLTFFTVKTGSIWPAAILHAVNNGTPSILRFFVNEEIVNETLPNPILSWAFLLIPVGIVAGICWGVMCKDEKNNNSSSIGWDLREKRQQEGL